MRIEDQGYVITDVPGVKNITIEPSSTSPDGAEIDVAFDDDVLKLTTDELSQIIDAFERARGLVANMSRPDRWS